MYGRRKAIGKRKDQCPFISEKNIDWFLQWPEHGTKLWGDRAKKTWPDRAHRRAGKQAFQQTRI